MEPQSQELQMARQSMVEELQAIDYYQGRIDMTEDEALKKILIHNRDEEKAHVAMLMEWIRANDPVQDKMFEEHD